MAKYDLNERAGGDSFEFTLDGFKYIMDYPSSEDVLKLTEISEKADEYKKQFAGLGDPKADPTPEEASQRNELEDKIKLSGQTMIDWCMGYAHPEMDTAPNLKETLMKKSIKYMLVFIDMVKTEISE